MINRRKTRKIMVGNVAVGGDAPISVQSMTNTLTADVKATIEQIFRYGSADIGKAYLDCITSAARQYVADIFATLRKYEYNPDLMRLFIVGGGGCLIRHFGQYDESRVTIVDDICATAKGYEYLAFSSLRRKG